ncbi:MAG: DNA mismatch endonuclease Vsr [Clostridia bacterium]|nr:DNA mismatch endonuclease Vsr [Clostridia bacterium]
MSDTFDHDTRSWIMAQVKSRDTSPEMRVRRALHRAGYRYRLHRADLPGKPDIVLPRYEMAIFVNGCFWHVHGCKRTRIPATNQSYWTRKLTRNKERDQAEWSELEKMGWRVRVVWECQADADIARLLNELALLGAHGGAPRGA